MPIDLSEEKIRYVALGDSISEGYNGEYNFAFAGSMKKNKKITGTSWPAFFARFIQKLDKNYLESYDNFAISGTRPCDWNYFLQADSQKYNYENSKEKILFGLYVENTNKQPEKNRLTNLFGEFGKTNLNDFNYLVKKVKKANLITMNIGANSILPKIPISNLTEWLFNPNRNVDQIKKEFKSIVNSCFDDMVILVKRLKQLNPLASIVLVGYVAFFTPLYRTINNLFFKKGFNDELISYFYLEVNNLIKKVAKKTKVIYIDVSNNLYWSNNANKLTKLFFEVHPTNYGYKKIAQDVLIKLALSNEFFKQKPSAIIKSIPTFNLKYLKNDLGCFFNVLNFSNSNYSDVDLIQKIYGKNNSALFKKTKEEKDALKLVNPIFFEQSIDLKNDPNFEVRASIKNAIYTIFSFLNINLNSSQTKFIENSFDNHTLTFFLEKTKIISTYFQHIQNELNKRYDKNQKVGVSEFLSICFAQFWDFNFLIKVIIDVLKYKNSNYNEVEKIRHFLINIIVQSKTNKLFKENLASIITAIIRKIFKNKRVELTQEHLYKLIYEFLDEQKSQEILIKLINFLFANSKEIVNVKNQKDFIKLLNLWEYNINYKKLFKLFIKNEEFLSEVGLIILNKIGLKIKTKKDSLIVIKFLNSLIELFDINFILNKMFKDFVLNFFFSSKTKINFQSLLSFIFEKETTGFWKKLNQSWIINNKDFRFDDLVNGFNYIFANIKFDGMMFQSIINLKTLSSIDKAKNIEKTFNLLKISNKFSHIEPIYNYLTLMAIKKSNALNQSNKSKDPYYQFVFRLIAINLLLSYKLMLKKGKEDDIFWPLSNTPSIVKFTMKFFLIKRNSQPNDKNFVLKLLGEESNPNLIRKTNEQTRRPNQLIWYIYALALNGGSENLKEYEQELYKIIKKGFID